MERTPHELWLESGGDGDKYRALMIEHGLLIDRSSNPPEPHLFEGKTVGCACSVCGGRFNASWHVEALAADVRKAAEEAGVTPEEFEEIERLFDEQISTQQRQRAEPGGEGEERPEMP